MRVLYHLCSHGTQYIICAMAQWWSTSLPRRGSRVRSPSRALLDNKKDFQMGCPFLLSEKCGALLETQLLCSLGSISQDAKAPLGRARTKVHWTLWHPSRALLDNKRDFRMGKSFFVIREVRGTSRNPTALQFGFDFSGR